MIAGLQPLLSHHFNLTVEAAVRRRRIRGYSFAVIPISWQNRKAGISKLNISEMGSRYLFIVLDRVDPRNNCRAATITAAATGRRRLPPRSPVNPRKSPPNSRLSGGGKTL